MFPRVIVLNLRRSHERKAFMSEQAQRHGIAVEFVESIDARELAERGESPPPGLSIAEWACLRTHMATWRRISQSDRPAVVLEDDVQLRSSFPAVVAASVARLPEDALLLLGHHSTFRTPGEGVRVCFWPRRIVPGHRMGRVAEFAMGAYAIAITPGAARRLVRFAEPERMPADWVTGYSPRAGVRLLAITPPCVTPAQLAASSTIADRPSTGYGNPRPEMPRFLSAAWLFARRLGIASSGYTLRLER